jgi:hypothetical protein
VQAKSAKIKERVALVANFRYICVTYVAENGHRNAILVQFDVVLDFLKLFELRFRDLHPFGSIDLFCRLTGRCCTISSGRRCLKKSVDVGKGSIGNVYYENVRTRTWPQLF